MCIETDKQITVTEAELLRVISALLDCPMPALATPAKPAPEPVQRTEEALT